MSKTRMSWLFTLMVTGVFLMCIGFKGYHVSYQSIIEVFQGDRLVKDIFEPRAENPIKRIHYDLADTTSYYSESRYRLSLKKVCRALLKDYSKQDITLLLQSIPALTEVEKAHYATLRYAEENSEEQEIAKYLKKHSSRCISNRFNLLERLVFSAAQSIDKARLIQRITNANLLINYNTNRVQGEFAIFKFSSEDKLTHIVSR